MDSVVLEVGIGLAVVFFIVATLVSAINEVVTRVLNIRSKLLWSRLDELLTGTDHTLGAGFVLGGVFSRIRPRQGDSQEGDRANARLDEFARTRSVWALDYVASGRKTKVAQIPAKVFGTALLEVAESREGESLAAKVGTLADEYEGTPVGAFLRSRGAQVATDVDRFLDATDAWFDAQMQVLTLTYRRNSKIVLGAAGLLVAILFNVNAFTIGSELLHNGDLRATAVALAEDISANDLKECQGKKGEALVACAQAQLATFGDTGLLLPSERNDAVARVTAKETGVATFQTYFSERYFMALQDALLPKGTPFFELLLGWAGLLVTALAVSLGGPFWFDLVKHLTGLRRGS